jgi:hypothetical protein
MERGVQKYLNKKPKTKNFNKKYHTSKQNAWQIFCNFFILYLHIETVIFFAL